MLVEGDLCSLSQIVDILQIPLTQWLARERDKSARLGTYWEPIFSNIHRTFDLPRSHPPMGAPLDIIPNHELFTLTQERLFMIGGLKERVKFLASSFEDAGCFEFALLLLTLSCDMDHILNILGKNHELWKPYFEMLGHENK